MRGRLFNAFRSLPGIAGGVTAPTYAELYAKKSRSTTPASAIETAFMQALALARQPQATLNAL